MCWPSFCIIFSSPCFGYIFQDDHCSRYSTKVINFLVLTFIWKLCFKLIFIQKKQKRTRTQKSYHNYRCIHHRDHCCTASVHSLWLLLHYSGRRDCFTHPLRLLFVLCCIPSAAAPSEQVQRVAVMLNNFLLCGWRAYGNIRLRKSLVLYWDCKFPPLAPLESHCLHNSSL